MTHPSHRWLLLLPLLLAVPTTFTSADEVSGIIIPRDDDGMYVRNDQGQFEVSWTPRTKVALVANTRLLNGFKGDRFEYRIHSSNEVVTFPVPRGPITGIKTSRGGKQFESTLREANEDKWLSERGLALYFNQEPDEERLGTADDPRYIGVWDATTKPRTLSINGTKYEISMSRGGQTSALLYNLLGVKDCKPFVNRATVVGTRRGDILIADEIHLQPIGDQTAHDDPKLPRYLFIGDSISGNYDRGLRAALEGKFNLHHPPTNCGPSGKGAKEITAWLGAHDQPGRQWDVISFNHGHWDSGNTKHDYQANLEKVITELKKTGARLIWVTTCPVPNGYEPAGSLDANGKAPGRTTGVMQKYLNPWAAEVIARHPEISICDQWQFVKDNENGLYDDWWTGKNVHFSGEPADALGKFLARHVVSSSVSSAERPNVLIVFTDDQGYGDLGCYGNEKNRTPRLDRLAKEGTRFTSFYSQTVCGPSRSALLTGRHPIRSKGWGMPASEITFAELMKGAGYQTACIGKWDVSNRKPIVERMPNAQGFDYYFGTLGANDGGGVSFHENNEKAGSTRDMGSLTTLYTDKAIEYLKERRDPGKPFVLYVAHTMMHTIIDASDRFRGKSKGGLYGDVVEEFDYETGRLLDVLDDLELTEDTLVIYTSDNGPWNQDKYTKRKKGHPEGAIFWGEAGPLRNGKGSPYEGGYRLPCIVRWPGKVPAGRVSDAVFATIDFLPTFANLTGFEVPEDRRVDGIDQTELLLGERETGREHFYFHDAGVRRGRWKYLKSNAHFHGYAVEDDRAKVDELYDLEADLGERRNVAAEHPETVAELKALMESIESGDRLRPSDNDR